jgi:hypothetical protein
MIKKLYSIKMLVERGLSAPAVLFNPKSLSSDYEICGDSVLTINRIDNYDSGKYCLDVKSNPGANLSL